MIVHDGRITAGLRQTDEGSCGLTCDDDGDYGDYGSQESMCVRGVVGREIIMILTHTYIEQNAVLPSSRNRVGCFAWSEALFRDYSSVIVPSAGSGSLNGSTWLEPSSLPLPGHPAPARASAQPSGLQTESGALVFGPMYSMEYIERLFEARELTQASISRLGEADAGGVDSPASVWERSI